MANSSPHLTGFSAAYVSNKNRPTVLFRTQDALHKLNPAVAQSEKQFEREVARMRNIKPIWSAKDLAEALKQNNVKFDDVTIVYCRNPHIDGQVEQHAVNFARHESGKQVLEVRDAKLAQELKMEPGKFYCYYKPTLINGFEQL